MAGFDDVLYQETKENLMYAAKGDPDIEEIVESQLLDMKECGFFDIEGDSYDEDEEED